MSKTVQFKLTIPYDSPTMRAEYLSTIVPLVGYVPNYPADVPAAIRTARSRWLLRGNELLKSGYNQIDSKKFMYARNCPPCCCLVEPWQTPCNLPTCPWCFARRVSKIYTKIRELVRTQKGTVLTYRQYRGYIDEETHGIYYDREGDLRGNVEEVLAYDHTCPKQFRDTYLKDAIGGYYWYTVAPLVYSKPATDGSCGKWLRLHSCVAVMPADWDTKMDDTIIIKNPTDMMIATSIGNIFRYPPGWMASDASVMATFLNAVKGRRFLSSFGYCKRAPTTDPDGAIIGSGRQTPIAS